jgi:hypothetical protein
MRLTVQFDDVRDLGERILALGTLEGIGPTTGMTVGGELAQLFTYREGNAIGVRDFGSHAEALEAAGQSE